MIPTGYWLNQYPDSNNLLSALSNFYSSGGSSKISLIDLYYLPTQCPGILRKKHIAQCTSYNNINQSLSPAHSSQYPARRPVMPYTLIRPPKRKYLLKQYVHLIFVLCAFCFGQLKHRKIYITCPQCLCPRHAYTNLAETAQEKNINFF